MIAPIVEAEASTAKNFLLSAKETLLGFVARDSVARSSHGADEDMALLLSVRPLVLFNLLLLLYERDGSE